MMSATRLYREGAAESRETPRKGAAEHAGSEGAENILIRRSPKQWGTTPQTGAPDQPPQPPRTAIRSAAPKCSSHGPYDDRAPPDTNSSAIRHMYEKRSAACVSNPAHLPLD